MNSLHVLKYQLFIFKAFGLWPPVQPRLYDYIYTSILFYFVTLGFIASLAASIMYVKSIKQVIDNLVISSSVILALIKGIIIYFNKPKVLQIFELVKRLDDRLNCKNTNEVKPLLDVYAVSKKLFQLFFGCYMTAWVVLAFQSVYVSKEKVFWSSTALYPHEISANQLIYWVLLLFQGYANFFLCVLVAALDTYGVVLNLTLGGHIDVLAYRLQSIGSKHVECKNVTVMDDEEENSSHLERTNCDDDLRECVKTFTIFLRFSKLLEDVMSSAYIFQFGISGIVLCTCAYQLSVADLADLPTLAFIILYFISMTIQIYMPCYFGTLLLYKSDKLTEAAYNSDWIERDLNFKRSLLIFTQGTYRPMTIVAGGLFMLNLRTFLSIVRSAYSMFALLRNVQQLT